MILNVYLVLNSCNLTALFLTPLKFIPIFVIYRYFNFWFVIVVQLLLVGFELCVRICLYVFGDDFLGQVSFIRFVGTSIAIG